VRLKHLLALIVTMGMAGVTSADELFMKNGSRIVGTLVSAEGGKVIFDTPFAGKITIGAGNIERMVTAEKVTIMMTNGEILRDRVIDSTDEQLIAVAEGEAPVMFAPGDIDMVNPEPWQIGEGYKWSGEASAALETQRGNTDTDEYDMAAKTIWRSLNNRFTIDGSMELDENSGEKTADNWDLQFKYDRFLKNTDNYLGARTKFEYDKFADLDLRTTIGPYLGRQFLDRPVLSIAGELGPVWVDEQFDVAEDQDYYAMNWDFSVTSDVIGFGTMLYFEHDGTLSFEDTDDLILNTVAGLRMPLIFGFETKLEAKWEYDRGAVDGVDELDETYNFGIGYRW